MDFGRDLVRRVGSMFSGTPTTYDRWAARELAQVQQDSRPDAMARWLANNPALGKLIWEMKRLGQDLRGDAAHELYTSRGGLPIWPDSDGPIAYGTGKVLWVTCQRASLEFERVTADSGLEQFRERLSTRDVPAYPIYAWIQTFNDQYAPLLFGQMDCPLFHWMVENVPKPFLVKLPLWEFHAACALGVFLRNGGCYIGPETDSALIYPPNPYRDPIPTALAHMFAKALLGLGDDCPEHWPCRCNYYLAQLRQVPYSHPEATGVSLMPFARRSPESSPVRGMTPPPPPPEPYTPRRPTSPPPSRPQSPPYRPTSPPTSPPRDYSTPPLQQPVRPTPPPPYPTPPPERFTPPPPPPPAEQRHQHTLGAALPPGAILRQWNDEHRQDNGHNGNGNGQHERHSDEYPTIRELGSPFPPSHPGSTSRKLSEDDLVIERPTVEFDESDARALDDALTHWEEEEARDRHGDRRDLDGEGEGKNSNPGIPVRPTRRPRR